MQFFKSFCTDLNYGKISTEGSRDCTISRGDDNGTDQQRSALPGPPVAVLDLTAPKTAYITALNAAIAAAAAAEAARR